MKILILVFFILLLSGKVTAQMNTNTKLDSAFANAKAGMRWALKNIPESRSSINKQIIRNDELIAKVKLSKEIKGVSVESTGYFRTFAVTVKIYRSYSADEE